MLFRFQIPQADSRRSQVFQNRIILAHLLSAYFQKSYSISVRVRMATGQIFFFAEVFVAISIWCFLSISLNQIMEGNFRCTQQCWGRVWGWGWGWACWACHFELLASKGSCRSRTYVFYHNISGATLIIDVKLHSYLLPQDVGHSQEWLIGTSKKACQSCWLLHKIYNKSQLSHFTLPGTHRIFFSWVPPPGLPNSILIQLRDALVEVCVSDLASPAHSQQSSICSATSIVKETSKMLNPGMEELQKWSRRVQGIAAYVQLSLLYMVRGVLPWCSQYYVL